MLLNLDSTHSQVLPFFKKIEDNFCSLITDLRTGNKWICFLAIPFTCTYLSLELVKTISFLGEAVLKGLANLFGAPFFENCRAGKGAFMLLIAVPFALYLCGDGLVKTGEVFFRTLLEPRTFAHPLLLFIR